MFNLFSLSILELIFHRIVLSLGVYREVRLLLCLAIMRLCLYLTSFRPSNLKLISIYIYKYKEYKHIEYYQYLCT